MAGILSYLVQMNTTDKQRQYSGESLDNDMSYRLEHIDFVFGEATAFHSDWALTANIKKTFVDYYFF
ncbi:hypothetical protein [Formosimonas limnophila]|nr:hypothetical protein [Formosimonas limnophila]